MNYTTLHVPCGHQKTIKIRNKHLSKLMSNMFGHCKFTFDFFCLPSQHFVEVSPQQCKLGDDMNRR